MEKKDEPLTAEDLLKEFDFPLSTKDIDKNLNKTLRNRMAAQISRERKKAYEKYLNEMNDKLTDGSQKMDQEMEILIQKVAELENSFKQLAEENEELRRTKEKLATKDSTGSS